MRDQRRTRRMTTPVTISTDQISFNGDNGFDFDSDDEAVTINVGDAVAGFDGGDGVDSLKSASHLFNNGHILGSQGVSFAGNTAAITNNASGDIIGISVGALFVGATVSFTNHGLL